MKTRWTDAAAAGETWKEYPRPALVRSNWINLNGFWKYAFTQNDRKPDIFAGDILVPFSPESDLSGVNRQLLPGEYLWYQRQVFLPEQKEGCHYLLHFGAVDQSCVIWINQKPVYRHCGGYLPFTVSLKEVKASEFTLTVQVTDDTEHSYHSRGKQKLKRGGMFYTAQSGIWQTVWLEQVPDLHITDVKITPDAAMETVLLQLSFSEIRPEHEKITVLVRPETEHDSLRRDHPEKYPWKGAGRGCVSEYETLEEYSCFYYLDSKEAKIKFMIPEPELWMPDEPFLYHLDLFVGQDHVESYFAFRFLSKEETMSGYLRFCINGEPVIQTGVLDQGYWPDGLLTAPSDEALIYDIQTMQKLGYNMLRKHIKLEPQRWYYHCDRLGMLVWQDMVCGGSNYQHWFVTYVATLLNIRHISLPDGPVSRWLLSRTSARGREEFLEEMEASIHCLYNHPSIITWVPFNEGWGQFDAAKVCEMLYELDETRFVDHASGWFDQKAGDVKSLHHYFFGLHFKAEEERVLAMSEYGGFTWQVPEHTWTEKLYGYGSTKSGEELTQRYLELHRNVMYPAARKGMSAFVFTQLSDVEEEANGILTYDREVCKLDQKTVRKINAIIRKVD